jgi:hypothetical protein
MNTREKIAEKIAELISHGLDNKEIAERLEAVIFDTDPVSQADLVDVIRHLMMTKPEPSLEDGTSGQDRANYTDDQDRESYVPDEGVQARLVALANELGTDASIELDDLVHDTCSNTASNINNEGVEGQIKFLLKEGVTVKEIEDTLTEAGKH